MKYLQILKDNNLLDQEGKPLVAVPVKTRNKIKILQKLNESIAESEKEIAGIASTREKKNAEEKLNEAKDKGQELDDDIVGAIERYLKNKDHYDTQAQKLKDARNKTKPVEGAAAVVEPPVVTPDATPAAEPGAGAPPLESVVDDEPATTAPVRQAAATKPVDKLDKDGKKKGSTFGWLIAGLVIVAGAAVGINLYKNK